MANQEVSMDEKKISKPGYDARLKYYEIVGDYLREIMDSIFQDDLHRLYRGLEGLSCMVTPYIDADDVTALREGLDRVDTMFSKAANSSRHQAFFLNRVRKHLLKLYRELHVFAKHMMLPVNEEEVDEWDEEAFKRGSDL